jgi:DNA-binding NarL/FixJ family response regulator
VNGAETPVVTSVLICDELPAAREALRRAVEQVPGITRVDLAARSDQVMACWARSPYDLLLLDLGRPHPYGLETLRRLLARYPTANVVMLTLPSDRDAVGAAMSAGAHGFLHKYGSRDELSATIAVGLTGPMSGIIPVQPRRPSGPVPDLTERERQVLTGMANGKSNAEIGRELYLSEDTIKTHARRLFRKLDVGDRAEAVASGFRLGFVS